MAREAAPLALPPPGRRGRSGRQSGPFGYRRGWGAGGGRLGGGRREPLALPRWRRVLGLLAWRILPLAVCPLSSPRRQAAV